jgi:LemA protein
MKKGIAIIIILVVLAIIVMWGVGKYNTLVGLDEGVQNAWAKVESAYQRRADLIPNLVNTVKGYAEHEQETFTAVTEARSKVSQVNIDPANITPEQFAAFQTAQDGLSSALSRLLVTVERYPELKANQNFLELQSQLEGTENRIKVERDRFNDLVKEFNVFVRRIPNNIIASLFGFDNKQFFESAPGAEEVPVVEF